MKKNDSYARMQRQQFSTLLIVIPLLTLTAIFGVVNPHNDIVFKLIILVPDVLLLIVGGIAFFQYRSNLKRVEQRRERALQGDRSLLAETQPLPDPYVLPMPTTIKLDQSRRAVVFLVLASFFVFFMLFVIGIVSGSSQSHHSPGNNSVLLFVLVILGGAVVAFLVALVLIFFLLRRQLIFTMRFYELSNERTTVLWANMPTRTLFRRREQMSYVEYRRKVEALLSLIVARTELPLYDLSPSPGPGKKFLND